MRWVKTLPAVLCLSWGGAAIAADSEVPASSVELLTADVQVSADGSAVQTTHAELRADNDAGALAVSHVSVPFNQGMQQVEIVEAHTLKADGRTVPVDPGTIYEQPAPQDQQTGMITDRRVKVLLFPQFAAGDTAVYTVRLKTLHPFFPGEFYYGEAFPRLISYKEVRETVTAPTAMNLRVEAHDVEVSKKTDGANTIYTAHYAAPVPKAVETVAVSPLKQQPRFFLSSFKDYAALGRAYAALSQPKIVVTDQIKALAAQITAGVSDRREQARRMYEWVAKHIRYVGVELGRGSFVPHDVDTVLANGYGDCKDHDVLLQALLKAKGIAAESVLINSGNAYALTEAPSFASLDHVITHIPEFDVYLDSNAPAPFGVLPIGEYGKPVVRVSAEGAVAATMPVVPQGLATIMVKTVSRLDDKGILSGTTTTTATGPFSIPLRLVGLGVQAIGPQKAAETDLKAHGYKDASGKLTADPPADLTPSYTIAGEFSAGGWADWLAGKENDVLPGGMRVFDLTGDGAMGPFYPGDLKDDAPTPCYSSHEVEDISLEVPPGAHFASTPSDTRIETANILFTAHWTLANNTLAVHREFTSRIDKPLCTGAVRKETAAALKKIADSYETQISIQSSSGSEAASTTAPAQASTFDESNGAAYDQARDAAGTGDFSKATQILAKLSASLGGQMTDDQAFAIHYLQGYVYLRDNQPAKAVDELSEAIKLKPDANTDMYSMRAGAYMMLRKPKLAAQDFAAVLAKSPDNLNLRQVHANLASQAGDYEAAAEDYNYLVRANTGSWELLLQRATVRQMGHMYAEAADDYERAEKLGAPQQTVLEGLCENLARTDKLGEATYQCSRALQVNAYGLKLLEARGIAYFRLGKLDEALADFGKASHTYPQSADYLYELGVAKLKKGDKSGQKDVDAAKQRSPGIARRMTAQKINL
ncbi:MAG: DUF3857 domain-containing protein [Alphaproteobacteria bacterium]|nr:DUF3857 domain-containing protein [Alphaproteobacteria bacterium]